MAGWHFVTVDKATSEEIRHSQAGKVKKGWGSIPVSITLGTSSWDTSIFPCKDGTYLLPLKSTIRKKEGLGEGDVIHFACVLRTQT